MNKIRLNKYEAEIEKNAYNFNKISKKKKRIIEDIIKKANEKKSITLRLNNQDLNLLKYKAQQEGLPYQTLISSIIHKYVSNRLIDENNIIKVVKLLK